MFRQFLILIVICAVSESAEARMSSSRLLDIVEKSDVIVVVSSIRPLREKADGSGVFEIDVETCLKGKLEKGLHPVKIDAAPLLGPYGFPANGVKEGNYIVFLDTDGDVLQWRFVGWPRNKKGADNSVLFMANGFAYRNRHVVAPSAVTLPQLRTMIGRGELKYTLQGPLFFARPGSFERTTRNIELFIRYNKGRQVCEIRGLEPAGSWSVDGIVGIGEDDGRSLGFTLARPGGGTISFIGKIRQARRCGIRMDCGFGVNSPYFATVKQLDEFLRDETVVGTSYALNIVVLPADSGEEEEPVHLKFNGGDGVEGSGVLEGWGAKPLIASGGSTDELRFSLEEGRTLVLKFGYQPELIEQADDWFDLFVDTNPFMHDGKSWSGDIYVTDAKGEKSKARKFRSSLDGVFLVRKEIRHPEGQ